MKNDKNLKRLWQLTTDGMELTVAHEELFSSLKRANKSERLMRAYEFSDIFGGFIVLIITALILEVPLVGKIGAVLFFGTFISYHIRAFRVKRVALADGPNLRQVIRHELDKLDRRIALLSDFIFYLICGLGGCFVFFISYDQAFVTVITSLVLLSAVGSILYWMVRSALKKKYLPMKVEIEQKLAILQQQS